MVDDHSAARASKIHAEPVEAGFCALSGMKRTRSSFDGHGMISDYVPLANLYLVCP
jgi:hypothetical protein